MCAPCAGVWRASLQSAALDAEEVRLVSAMRQRLRRLAAAASQAQVKVMVDAEHTYFQPAIDHLTLELSRAHNRGDAGAVIFNTYQVCALRPLCAWRLFALPVPRRLRGSVAALPADGVSAVRGLPHAGSSPFSPPHGVSLGATMPRRQRVAVLSCALLGPGALHCRRT